MCVHFSRDIQEKNPTKNLEKGQDGLAPSAMEAFTAAER